MVSLELLLAVAFAAALLDFFATRGYAAAAAGVFMLAGLLWGAGPATPYLKPSEFAAFVAGVYLAIVAYSHFYMRGADAPQRLAVAGPRGAYGILDLEA